MLAFLGFEDYLQLFGLEVGSEVDDLDQFAALSNKVWVIAGEQCLEEVIFFGPFREKSFLHELDLVGAKINQYLHAL